MDLNLCKLTEAKNQFIENEYEQYFVEIAAKLKPFFSQL